MGRQCCWAAAAPSPGDIWHSYNSGSDGSQCSPGSGRLPSERVLHNFPVTGCCDLTDFLCCALGTRRSVAEPPLFWAAPAPDGQGPGADSDLLGSAPAPGKKRRLQAALAPASYTKIFHFKLSKS